MKKLLTLFALVAITANASAFHPCRQQAVVVHEQQAVIVTPAVQVIQVPVYGLVPFGATYAAPVAAAPVASPAVASSDEAFKALLAEIKALRADLTGAGPKAQADAGDGQPAIKLLQTRCAKCHGSTADKDGGAFHLFADNGSFIPVRPGDAKRIVRLISSGQMPPPPGQIPESEKAILIQAFGGQDAPPREAIPLPKVEPKKTALPLHDERRLVIR